MISYLPQIIIVVSVAVIAYLVGRKIPQVKGGQAEEPAESKTQKAVKSKLRREVLTQAIVELWRKFARVIRSLWKFVWPLSQKGYSAAKRLLTDRKKSSRKRPDRVLAVAEVKEQEELAPERILPEELQKLARMVKQGKYEEAERGYIDYIKRHVQNPTAYVELGDMYLRCHNYSDAENSFTYAIKLGDSSETTKLFLAKTVLKAGKAKRSLEVIDDVLDVNPKNVEALIASAHAYRELGDTDNERIAWNKVLVYDPDNAEAKAVAGEDGK